MTSILQILVLCSGSIVLYGLGLVVYRLFLHPLSRFPGPKFTAATQWYEAYYDLVKYPGGQFIYEIDRMHRVYGPIVRITPNEIHVKDSSWEKVLYTSYSKGVRNKYPPAAAMVGLPNDVFGTIDQEHHHRRRTAINAYFSRKSVEQAEPILHGFLDIFCKKIQDRLENNGYIKMNVIALALTADTSSKYAFGKDLGLLEDDNKALNWYKTNKALATMIPTVRQFPWCMPLSLKIPVELIRILSAEFARVLDLRHMYTPPQAGPRQDKNIKSAELGSEKNVWTSILSSKLPPEEKEALRMADEAFTLIAAGGEGTGRAICIGLFYVLSDKSSIMPPLMEELLSVMPEKSSKPSMRALEKLPLLTGIVKETLRIAGLLATRLPLIDPHEALRYGEWCIPPGTPVSMSQRDVFLDPTIFPDPNKFDPTRWLPSNPELQHLNQHFYPFGRGDRMCVGWHLAMTEIYMILATIIRRFDLELHDTIRERDIDIVRDSFLGEPSLESKGVRVRLATTLPNTDS
ncbi:putative flavonoid 3-hydroxylase [Periconia macrospinosa]|uniref:Putative flavonoid 3-hydroxylase n=1 Tax=Periconia macrospinosa TaxID=97972 RepID=A0A2V1E8Q2_9PLEO|nr:putative flavonoid 3-hydroxylase [Periconia macrospinosa]